MISSVFLPPNVEPARVGILIALDISLALVGCTAADVDSCDATRTCSTPDLTHGSYDADGAARGTGGGDGGSTGGGAATTGGVGASGGEAGMTGGASGGAADAGNGGSRGGAGGSDGGAAATGGAVPCGGACKGKTPVCDTAMDKCVECTKSSQCSSTKSACDMSANKCVECVGNSDCRGNANGAVCDTSKRVCVQCVGSGDCATKTATPVCDTGMNTCVQCLASTDCTAANAARCDGEQCKPCATNDDCSHVTGKGVCDGGTCVQCTNKDASACGMKDGTALVCDSLKRTCTTSKVQSADVCQPCVSDAECVLGEMCVLDTLQSGQTLKNVGYFCHWKKGDTANGAPADCFANGKPYIATLTNVSSIDGLKADICALRVSSCPALADYSAGKNCGPTGSPNDQLCGFSPTDDAKCGQPPSSSSFACTMTCASADDCPGHLPCLTKTSPFVCTL